MCNDCGQFQNEGLEALYSSRVKCVELLWCYTTGQFWGSHLVVQPQPSTPPCTPPLPPLPTRRPREHYDVAVFLRNLHHDQQFSAMLVERNWGMQKTPCLYAGDRQGHPVIQGEFTDYEVEDLFSVQYRFSKFDEDKCPPASSGGWNGWELNLIHWTLTHLTWIL